MNTSVSPHSSRKQNIRGQEGSAIVIVLIVLASLAVIGIGISNISTTEQTIVNNEVAKKISFFNSDAGIHAVPKVISQSINDRATPSVPAFTFTDTGNDQTTGDRSFYRELAGFATHDTASDISFQNDATNTTGIDVERVGSFTLLGGGAEFGSGAEGHAVSLKGLRYLMDSTGNGPKNAVTVIEARYLKVLGTAGGL